MRRRSPPPGPPEAGSVQSWERRMRILLAIILAVAIEEALPAASVAAPPGHYAELNGIRMYYELSGAGPVLVLLHGGAGNGGQFSRQIPDFEKHFRLVIPDMCAQGRTTDRPGPLTYHAMAEDVIALM